MKWIEINLYDEDAKVPPMSEEVLCFRQSTYKMFYTVAEYMGFVTWNEQQKRHIFYVEDGQVGFYIEPTHWGLLPEPPEEAK